MVASVMEATRADEDARKRLLWTAGIVSSLVMLDSNLVAVSLPSIARSLDASFTEVEWVISAYVLPFTALLLAAGTIADLKGRRRAVLIGLGLFTAASVLCGLAPSVLLLNLGRSLQGIGAAFLLTAALAVINHAFQGPERARAYAFWGACLGVAITMGPIVGGLINDALGWRWAFLINLPLGAALIRATLIYIPESRDPDAVQLDRAGVVFIGLALLSLTFALNEGNARGWGSSTILGCLALSAVSAAVFVAVEARQPRPMLDLALFRSRTFLGAVAAMIGYAAGAQVLVFYLPLALQGGFGFAPAGAGLAMLPFALPMFLTPRLMGRRLTGLTDRRSLVLGLAVTCVGDAALALTSHASYPVFAAAMLLAGCGAGMLNSETARVIQGAVPPDRGGMASGISGTTRFTALLVGVAGLGAIFGHAAVASFADWAMARGVADGLAMTAAKRFAAGDAADALASLPTDAHATAIDAGRRAATAAFAAAAAVASAVAALAAIATFCLLRRPVVAAAAPARGASAGPALE